MNVNLSVFYSWFLLLLSILVGMSSSTLLNLWLMMEINTILFLLIVLTSGGVDKKAVAKYFMTQAASAMVMVLGGIMISTENYLSVALIQAAMVVKLGCIPAHLWYLSVIQDLSWLNITLVSTIQKILPIFVLVCTSSKIFIIFLVTMSSLSGVLVSYSLTLKRVFGYSSIMNLSWLLASTWSWSSMGFFFLIYFLTVLALCGFISLNNVELSYKMNSGLSANDGLLLGGCVLGLGGLPPFINFWAKLTILKTLVEAGWVSMMAGLMLSLMTSWLIYVYISLINEFILKSSIFSNLVVKYNGSNMFLMYLSLVSGLLFFI